MGLDMYMTQKIYIGAAYKAEERPGELVIKAPFGGDIYKIPIMYWRKANAIHKWFVDNVQNGVDDCGNYLIDEEMLEKLYKDLTKAILSQDPTVIPPTEGFFFGGTEADDYYWHELKRTLEKIKYIIDERKKPYDKQDPLIRTSDFYYHSSW